jgi:hypothetical protein
MVASNVIPLGVTVPGRLAKPLAQLSAPIKINARVSVVQLAWRSVPSVRWGRAGGMLLRNPGE